jgi:hypothetical protein
MDLLTCAYEKAVAYFSDQDLRSSISADSSRQSSIADGSESTGLHFTLNFTADADQKKNTGDLPSLPEPNNQTVEDAISITTRCLHQTESALPDAKRLVESATAAVEAANRRHEWAKQASMNAVVAAKSAKTMALLLDIEAKRAAEDATAMVEKARARAVAAKQTAEDAMAAATKAKSQANRVRKSEETAAAEAVCAQDHLEKEKARLKALTHTLVEARNRMKMFQGAISKTEVQNLATPVHSPATTSNDQSFTNSVPGRPTAARQQVMTDLLDIESSLSGGRQTTNSVGKGNTLADSDGPSHERRTYDRISYPYNQRPTFSIDGIKIPILDLSNTGMRLEADEGMTCPRIVRGAIAFAGRPPVKVTGKVIRQDDHGFGLKLVTRIGNHILDQERFRLSG